MNSGQVLRVDRTYPREYTCDQEKDVPDAKIYPGLVPDPGYRLIWARVGLANDAGPRSDRNPLFRYGEAFYANLCRPPAGFCHGFLPRFSLQGLAGSRTIYPNKDCILCKHNPGACRGDVVSWREHSDLDIYFGLRWNWRYLVQDLFQAFKGGERTGDQYKGVLIGGMIEGELINNEN